MVVISCYSFVVSYLSQLKFIAVSPSTLNSNGSFVTLSEPICRKVIVGCPSNTEIQFYKYIYSDLLYARVPKYHFDLPFLPCATYLLDPNYLNSGVLGGWV